MPPKSKTKTFMILKQANTGRYTKTIHRVGWMTEVRLLFERELKRLHRDKMSVVVRVAR
jgi:hypothetical protein